MRAFRRRSLVVVALVSGLLLLGTGACSKHGGSPTAPDTDVTPPPAADPLALPLPSPKINLTDLDTGEVTQYWVQFLDIRPNHRGATIYVPRGKGASGCNESGSTCPQFNIVSSGGDDLGTMGVYFSPRGEMLKYPIQHGGLTSLNSIWAPGMGSWSYPVGDPDCCKKVEVLIEKSWFDVSAQFVTHKLYAAYEPDVDYQGQLY
jgi:hypothetical protein